MTTSADQSIERLLQRVLAARPETTEEFEDLTEAIGWSTDQALAALRELGLVKVSGGSIRLVDPVQALTRNADAALMQAEAAFHDAQRTLGLLSNVTSAAGSEGSEMIGPVIRDHDRVWEGWWEQSAHLTPIKPGVVTPDAVMLRNQVLDDMDRVAADFIERNFHMRVLLDIEECADADGKIPHWLRRHIEAGVEVRAMIDPPSWFYIDDGVIGGVPLTWGQGNPAGMVPLKPSPLLAMAAAYFELLWRHATPIRLEAEDGWEPVLRLLEVGRSDKQIADALGLGLRTVRRRIAEAMDELGATSRFELGMCWAERQSR